MSPAQQNILMDAFGRQMAQLKTIIRKENQEAVQVMVQHGVKIITPSPAQVAEFKIVSEKAVQRLVDKSFSKKIKDEISAKLEAYRKKNQQ